MNKKTDNNSTLNDFLMMLAATTISIVLTFGTSAVIDRKKQNAEKREMVMMIMYDMRESLKELEQCGSDINAFFDAQVDAVAHPKKFYSYYPELVLHIPVLEYTTTTETIFRSNIETIQTIGDILFVETVSSFYDLRDRYKREVVENFDMMAQKAIEDYNTLRDFESDFYPFSSAAYLRVMKGDFEQCKLMMKVTDKDLDVFSIKKQEIIEATRGKDTYDSGEAIQERQLRKNRLQQAREEGRKELQ